LCKNCETIQDNKPLVLDAALDSNIQVKQNTALVNQSNAIVNYIDRAKIHDDIKDLLWFGDGPFKNYSKDDDYEVLKSFKIGSIEGEMLYRVSLMADEPSSIYTDLPVKKPQDVSVIPRPPYFPKYYQLTPEQRWIYLSLLINPYSSNIDIGYIFIFHVPGLKPPPLGGQFLA
jgi:hypothetical protein